MNTDERLSELQAKRRMLLQQLATPRDFRPEYLVARFRKCGRPYCHCAHDGPKGHGPSWALSNHRQAPERESLSNNSLVVRIGLPNPF